MLRSSFVLLRRLLTDTYFMSRLLYLKRLPTAAQTAEAFSQKEPETCELLECEHLNL